MKSVKASRYAQSARCYAQAQRRVPGGVNSNFRMGTKPWPLFFARAEGSRLYDVDGNEFLDYALGMGPVILGHADARVNAAVAASLAQGQLYAGQHPGELELAEQFCRLVPCAEMVRFSLTGSEAIHAALRLARASTGRRSVVRFEGHYHGWLDNIYVSPPGDASADWQATPGSDGQDPQALANTLVLPWNDLLAFRQVVERHAAEIAAVIMEPIMCNSAVILPAPGYLEEVREQCTRHGMPLIFDEVITGFRVGLGGAQEHLGVTPDLAVFAKAAANGYPFSCLAGRRELMELLASRPVMQGGTFNSNTVSCAAAQATLAALAEGDGAVYARLGELGSRLIEGLKQLATETGQNLHVQGLPAVFHTSFTEQAELRDYRSYRRCDLERQGQFVEALLEEGVRITDRGTWFLSVAHSESDIAHTLQAARAALQGLAGERQED